MPGNLLEMWLSKNPSNRETRFTAVGVPYAVMNAKEDSERLMNATLPVAERMLRDHGEFYPYAAYMKPGGEIVLVGAEDGGTDHPKSKDLLHVLRESFSDMAKIGECIATAIVINVIVDLPSTHSKSDAIQVCLEHSDGYAAEVFFPYAFAHDGHVVYGPTFAQGGKRELFGSG